MKILALVSLLVSTTVVVVTGNSLRGVYSNSSAVGLGCAVQASCKSGGVEGVCVSRSSGCCRGTFNSGNLCPGSDDIQVIFQRRRNKIMPSFIKSLYDRN